MSERRKHELVWRKDRDGYVIGNWLSRPKSEKIRAYVGSNFVDVTGLESG